MGTLKRRIIEEMEPKEEPPMGHMKDFDRRIRQGGDDAIAAVSELMPRWIPVSERLPEVDATVLVVIETPRGQHVSFLSRHKQDGFWTHPDGDVDDINVTHWMPLPEPPEPR